MEEIRTRRLPVTGRGNRSNCVPKILQKLYHFSELQERLCGSLLVALVTIMNFFKFNVIMPITVLQFINTYHA